MFLVYNAAPGEGPEPKKIGRPFDITVTPGQPWECKNEAFAKALIEAVPQVVETAAPRPAEPEPEPQQSESYDTNEEPSEAPPSFQGGE